ncbi:hypothetical protein F4820DRAFT_441904 [Hypoxylon rubiginosum]|uniref:Uncharacterized protein n=1 Tax=Hypoxylon rubiginosum TaxID=110542 RepID=A0ACB9YHX8_9PEZI|nr:hypothetical protein F4820DRAFT_441904 [Hypoxylon rubiginosum]
MFLQILHLAQAALTAYGGKQSYIAITNLRKYEEATKKLAEYSSTAEHQRNKTYTTQTSGVLALLLSLFASLTLALRGSVSGFLPRYLYQAAAAVALFFARQHMRGFWADKTPGLKGAVPKMGDYDEAQRKTQELLNVLDFLMLTWVATFFVALVIGY